MRSVDRSLTQNGLCSSKSLTVSKYPEQKAHCHLYLVSNIISITATEEEEVCNKHISSKSPLSEPI
jgi:hypothetical protein